MDYELGCASRDRIPLRSSVKESQPTRSLTNVSAVHSPLFQSSLRYFVIFSANPPLHCSSKDVRIQANEILTTNKMLGVMWQMPLDNITGPSVTLAEYSSLVEDHAERTFPGHNSANDIIISSCL